MSAKAVRKKKIAPVRFSRKTLQLLSNASDVASYYRAFGNFTVKQLHEVLCLRRVMKKTKRDYTRLSHVLNCARKENMLRFKVAGRYHGIEPEGMKTIYATETKNKRSAH